MKSRKPNKRKAFRPSERGPPRPGMVTGSQYAAMIGVIKARLTQWYAQGLPHVDGADDHGRLCKWLDPDQADAWRAANLKTSVDGEGRVRGIVEPRRDTPRDTGGADAERPSAPTARGGAEDGPPGRPAGDGASLTPPADGAPQAPSTAERIQEARASQAEDDAEKARFNRLKTQGLMVDRKAAIKVQEGFATKVGVAIDRMPADMATIVADGLKTSEHDAYTVLKLVSRRLREDLARQAEDAARIVRAGGTPPR